MGYRNLLFDLSVNYNGSDNSNFTTFSAGYLVGIKYQLLTPDVIDQSIHVRSQNGLYYTLVERNLGASARGIQYFATPIPLGGRSKLKITTSSSEFVRASGALLVYTASPTSPESVPPSYSYRG